MKFTTITINEWKDIYDLEVESGLCVYRGQRNCDWPLETSLVRESKRAKRDLDQVINSEHWMLREFRRRAHHYTDHLPPHEDFVGWLTLMQHHGAASRLLDFTFSFYVACYFAISGSDTDACVWAIDDGWLRSCGCNYAKKSGFTSPILKLRDDELDYIYSAANRLLIKTYKKHKVPQSRFRYKPAILMVEPLIQIRRLAVQQGVFLMPTDVSLPFEENLMATRKFDPYKREYAKYAMDLGNHIKKIVIPRSIHDHAMINLRAMNISAETLFPDIGGFARSITEARL